MASSGDIKFSNGEAILLHRRETRKPSLQAVQRPRTLLIPPSHSADVMNHMSENVTMRTELSVLAADVPSDREAESSHRGKGSVV